MNFFVLNLEYSFVPNFLSEHQKNLYPMETNKIQLNSPFSLQKNKIHHIIKILREVLHRGNTERLKKPVPLPNNALPLTNGQSWASKQKSAKKLKWMFSSGYKYPLFSYNNTHSSPFVLTLAEPANSFLFALCCETGVLSKAGRYWEILEVWMRLDHVELLGIDFP